MQLMISELNMQKMKLAPSFMDSTKMITLNHMQEVLNEYAK